MNIKFDLLGVMYSPLSWYFDLISFRVGDPGNVTRRLFFVSHDPVGWRVGLLFMNFQQDYELAFIKYMEAVEKLKRGKKR